MTSNARSYTQTSTTITSSSAEVVAASRDRKALILFNTGSTDIQIGIGTAAITIAASDHLAFTDGDCPINALVAATASGTSTLVVWDA